MVNQLDGFGGYTSSAGTGVQETSSATTGTVDFGATTDANFGDRSFTIDNGATVYRMGFYNTTGARTVILKIYLYVSGTSVVDVVNSQSCSHTGTGWEWFTLSSPFVVPGSGTYWAGVFCSDWGNIDKTTALNIEKFAAEATGSGVTFTDQNRETPMVGVEY